MDKETVISKIKKCLALAKSDNPNEAATALRQAQALMRQYDVNELDLSLADVNECTVNSRNTAIVNWEAHLSGIVADAFGCVRFSRSSRTLTNNLTMKKVRRYVFVGVGAAPEIAQYAFDVLMRQCTKARKAHMATLNKNCKPATRTARGDEFAIGWCISVQGLVERFASNEQGNSLVAQYMELKYPEMSEAKIKNRTAGKNITARDYQAGREEGKNAKLDRGVGTKQQQYLS